MISMTDFLTHLSSDARKAAGWVFGAVILIMLGYNAAMSTVTSDDLNTTNANVARNTAAIVALEREASESRVVDKISLCIDIAKLENDSHHVCLIADTREEYLRAHVDVEWQAAMERLSE